MYGRNLAMPGSYQRSVNMYGERVRCMLSAGRSEGHRAPVAGDIMDRDVAGDRAGRRDACRRWLVTVGYLSGR